MKKTSYQFSQHQPIRVMAMLLFFTLCLISFDALHAQNPNKKKELRINGKVFTHTERDKDNSRNSNCDRLPNRTIDGTCNNIVTEESSEWGAADIPFAREMQPAYGAPDFYNDMAGNCRLSPRAISNLVVAQSENIPSPRNLSSLVFTWGQFLDHDIDLTPEGETEYVPVLLPSNEPDFVMPIPFFRSEPYPGSGVTAPRGGGNFTQPNPGALNVYPNPGNGNINLSVHFLNEAESAVISVKDLNGKVMKQLSKNASDGILFQHLDLQQLTPGMYFITVTAGEEWYTERVVIE